MLTRSLADSLKSVSTARGGHGVAIVPSVLPTHRYRLRIVSLMHGADRYGSHLAILWDRRRVLSAYAEEFCQSLAAYMREIFPISQPAG